MKNNVPVIAEEPILLKLVGTFPIEEIPLDEIDSEQDPDLLEIEEAKRLFDEQIDLESFWAGRLLADRKSTRLAA